LEFTNFKTLFGKVLTGVEVVLSNNPAADPASAGVPPGHPPLRSFLGVPFLHGQEVVGMIGVANRPGGYAGTEQEQIEILTRAAGVLYDSYRRREREAALQEQRRHAEEALREREEQFRAVFETANDAIISGDSRGLITLFNPAAERSFGFSAADVMGKPLETIIPERFRERHREGLRRFVSTGQSTLIGGSAQLVGLRKDGTEFPLELSLTACTSARGLILTAIARDISPRRRSEAELNERVRLASLQANTAAALIQADQLREMLQRCAAGIVEHLEAAFARIWTLNAEQNVLELQASAGMYTHLDGPHSRVPVGTLKIGLIAQERQPHLTNSVIGDPRVADQEWARREGMVSFAGYPLIVDNRLVGVMAMFARRPLTDATLQSLGSVAQSIALGIERKRADEALHTRMATIDAADDAIVITNREGEIEYVNPAFSRATGYEPEEVVGPACAFVNSGAQGLTFHRARWETVLSGKVWRGEIMTRRKDGSLYPEEQTITPIADANGQIVRFVAIRRDITERKRAEEMERERNNLREAVRSLEQVFGVVGHELRTPLAGLRMMAEYLLTYCAAETAECSELLKSINDEVTRMADMVNNMLEAARLNSGLARWNWGTVDLEQACQAALDIVVPLNDPRKVQLSVSIQPAGLTMRGDADAIRRMVLNLVSNAHKHTQEGTIRVEVHGFERASERWVEIRVEDTGEGMAPNIVERLGQAFSLNSGVVGENYIKGTGLGLAICKGIAGAHGGTLSVASAEARGTTMTALLRADLAEPARTSGNADIIRRLLT
jgi:PAS domain S-box-containing protein